MISGLQKMTLLDYPGKVACTVFLHGCNLRCPFCHNSEFLTGRPEPVMQTDELLRFLKSRQGLLDGVCVSGGEPTLQPALPALLREIKQMGFAVKLDTNGCRPEVVKALVSQGLVDYIAMDVKNSPEYYAQTAGLPQLDLRGVTESLKFLICGGVEYELRTTVVEQLHSIASIEAMGKWLGSLVPGKKPKVLYLQSFVDRDSVAFDGLSAPASEQLQQYAALLTPYIDKVVIRNQ